METMLKIHSEGDIWKNNTHLSNFLCTQCIPSLQGKLAKLKYIFFRYKLCSLAGERLYFKRTTLETVSE